MRSGELHSAIRQGLPCLAAYVLRGGIMYLLYLDDAGSVGNKSEDYFILGGVAVPENSLRWLSHELEKYAQEISNQTSVDVRQIEFHASEIFSGKESPWNFYKDREQRKKILLNVLGIFSKSYSTIVSFACAVHKASYPSDNPVIIAFEDLSSRFDMFLDRISPGSSGQRGLMIMDNASYEAGLQSLTTSIRESGNRWGNQLRRIGEIPLFVDSKACRIVQLADHVAYSVFRRYNANDLTYFNIIESRFDMSDGIIHGLVHKQLNNRGCTCPACITHPKRSRT
jgi:hypothetical protein